MTADRFSLAAWLQFVVAKPNAKSVHAYLLLYVVVDVFHAGQNCKMRGQEGEGGGMCGSQLFADCPTDGGPLRGGRAPAQLVQDDQGGGAHVAQDVGHLLHLQGKGRRVALEAVGGANSGKQGVTNAELSLEKGWSL